MRALPEAYRHRLTPTWLAARATAALTRANLLVFNAVQGNRLVPWLVRWALLRAWGVDSRTHRVSEGCWFGGRDIHIGAGSFVNFGCVFDNLGSIRIGAGCDIGMQTVFATSTHAVGPSSRRAGEVSGRPIDVGDGCWIGARAIVLPGVSVGPGCIVAAGSVVNRDCEPNGLYAGNPAKRVRDLD
jgi:maltose O-acetyltransferase